MKAPKILPWVACKAGISEELALRMWRRAAREAAELTGCCTSSEYYRLAIERFIDLSEDEGEKCADRGQLANRQIMPSIRWIWRYQNRMSQVNLLAAQRTYRFLLSNWQFFLFGQKKAA